MIEVELPDGSIAEFPDAMPPEQIQAVLQQQFGTMPQEAPQQVPQEATAPEQYGGGMGMFRAATDASQAGLMGGFDDEIGAAMMAPIHAGMDWFKGDGFDVGKNYTRLQKQLDDQKKARRSERPVTSIAGEIAGGLALGGSAAKQGLTLAGRSLPVIGKTGAAALEGGAYGGLYGAGEANPGERLKGAGTGAAIGALTGGVMEKGGQILANRAARKASQAAAPAADELKNAAGQLYRASEAEGVVFKQNAVQRLGQNMKMAAGRLNDKLRPRTAGYVEEIDNLFNGPMTLETFDEFRQVLGKELGRATPDDARTLTRMKEMMDAFADNLHAGQMTGGAKGVEILKQARETWSRAKKAEIVESILDRADVKTGQYTQSGLANTIRSEMSKLYNKIQSGKVKGFSEAEVKLVRQMAKGGSQSSLVNLLAKFAPRGVVSFGAGQLVGSMIPGAGNILLPMAGSAAANAADRGMLNAAQTLRTSAATGGQVMPQLPNYLRPFIGGGVAGSTEVPRLLEASRGR